MQQLGEILTRQQELVAQAANGTYSTTQRSALDREARSLTDEYNRLVSGTEYNGIRVLSGTDAITIQSGFGTAHTTQIGVEPFLDGTQGAGTFTLGAPLPGSASVAGRGADVGDFNQDGKVDVVVGSSDNFGASLIVQFGDGTGQFAGAVTILLAPGQANQSTGRCGFRS